MSQGLNISIVIPARNEAAGLRQLLPRLAETVSSAEILVVDDGSTDDTAGVCAEFNVTRLRNLTLWETVLRSRLAPMPPKAMS